MNNEETIYQPMGEDETTQIQNDLTEKSSEGKKTAVKNVGASFVGGMVGAGVATLGMDAIHNKDEEAEDKTAEDVAAENPDAAAEEAAAAETTAATAEAATAEAQPDAADVKPEPQPAPQATAQSGSANAAHAGAATAQATPASYHETDYTGHGGADPVSGQPHTQTTGSHQSEGSNEVQVLGIYGEHGQSLQTAVVTDGEYVAAVVDIDGDGKAEVMAVDADHNGEIGEGEVFDIAGENVQMAGYEQAYVAQQQNDAPAYGASASVADNGGGNEVQILGMYEAEGDYGQTMQAAVFTNGVDVAAVVDVNGDGKAEVYVQDVNGNGQIEQNEIADISNNPVEMSQIEQAYALQQQAEAQNINTFVCDATDEQPDYNNGMDTMPV